jgi:RNA polymerase sigma factor (sigma-70 family)
LTTARQAEDLSDGQALERFLTARDQAAFRALVQRHAPLVWGVCRRVLRHPEDAEDVFQAAFLVLARKAYSIRKPDSVGSWLYGVAYRLALEARSQQARRATRERQVRTMPQPEAPAENPWPQLAPVLDEELQKLPAKYRRPLVLCYLEGKSYRQAAAELGWPLGSTSKRLARGREMLRQGLTRRGVTLPGALLTSVLSSRTAPAAPPALVNATVKAGLLLAAGKPFTGMVSGQALTLFQKGSRVMFPTKLKIALALALLLGGLGFAALARPRAGKPATAQAEERFPEPTRSKPDRQQAPKKDKALPPKPRPTAAETITVTGRVQDPAGKPVAGARVGVMAWTPDGRTPHTGQGLGQTKTDARGRYLLQVKKPSPARQLATFVRARGYGLAWNYLPAGNGAVIRLAPERILRIRLIDFQGEPASGVRVHLCRVGKPLLPPLDYRYLVKYPDRLDEAAEEAGMFTYNFKALEAYRGRGEHSGKGAKPPALRFRDPPPRSPLWPWPVTTDRQGRCTLRGLPRDQGIGLQVRDRRFAWQALAIKAQPKGKPREVTRALLPARVIEGTVVDAATGKPVCGARVRVPTRGGDSVTSAPAHPSIGEMDWKGRWGSNGYRLRWVAAEPTPALIAYFLKNDLFGRKGSMPAREVSAPDELPPVQARADRNGRFRLSLFVAGSYTVAVSGPGPGPFLSLTQTVGWPQKTARRKLKLSLTRGVRVKGVVTEKPSGRPVAGARVDFFSPGLAVPAGVSYPTVLLTGRDGRFEALLPPGSWHLLVNCASRVFVRQKIAAAKVIGKRPTRVTVPDGYESIVTIKPGDKDQFFYPDGWTALDLKSRAGTRHVAVKLRRVTLWGKLVGPDGKPVARARLFYRHPIPRYRGGVSTVDRHQVVWKLSLPVRGEPAVAPVEAKDGKFELYLGDVRPKYRIYFLDARNKWGAVAEVSGRDKAPTVKMAACGSANALMVDAQGKPRVGYRPLLWLLLPPGPHPAVRHSVWEGLAPDSNFIPPMANFHTPVPTQTKPAFGKVWWASADPLHYGKGFLTDGKGNISLSVLIPGATYRIFDPDGNAKDFKVKPGQALDLGKVMVKQVLP